MILAHRTHNNNQLRLKDVGTVVELKGWVAKKRNLGSLVFIDLRDKEGITQLVCDEKFAALTSKIKNEYVLYAKGKVIERSNKNKNIPTGEIEIEVEDLQIINTSETPPIIVADETDALEDTRLKYRYLDLRRPCMQKALRLRHEITKSVRSYFDHLDFIEVETPIIAKTTPEGARDYLIPSRVNKGKFYALPQSPQIFKQLLMIAGFERYYQIARCFRDEDLRADRQMEFTQIDFEVSFFSQEEFYSLVEGLFVHLFKEVMKMDLKTPFPRLTWQDAMNRYGSDKPDLRFDLPLEDVTSIFKDTTVSFLQSECVKGIKVSATSSFSRKDLDYCTDLVKKYKAKGLCFVKMVDHHLEGSSAKLLTESEKEALIQKLDLKDQDLFFFIADQWKTTVTALGALRNHLAKHFGYIDENKYAFLWIVDFPMFEYNEEGELNAAHHPFTAYKVEDEKYWDSDPLKIRANAYDIVLNGYELGSGSLRIFDQNMQQKVFEKLGLSDEDIHVKFGFFVEALKYGTPPHCGMGLGLDRIAMILNHSSSLRDVIAFPKNASAVCPMSEAPTIVDQKQLDELGIKIVKKEGNDMQ